MSAWNVTATLSDLKEFNLLHGVTFANYLCHFFCSKVPASEQQRIISSPFSTFWNLKQQAQQHHKKQNDEILSRQEEDDENSNF
mmetsp:Transcript_6699/g.10206  ORF Transcript_6699/g.10206 Transcript_6699/m.10206 type:complete len:84 (+) Transcript_6699:1240-1491(+)